MSNTKSSFDIHLSIPIERVYDLLITANESGAGYWARVIGEHIPEDADMSWVRADDFDESGRQHLEQLRQRVAEASISSIEAQYAKNSNVILSLTTLPRGWDGEDTSAPTDTAANASSTILAQGLTRISLAPNRIDPSVEGGIVLEYYGEDGRYCVFESYNSGETIFIWSLGNKRPFVRQIGYQTYASRDFWRSIADFCQGRSDRVEVE